VTHTRGFHPRRQPRLTQARDGRRSGCHKSSALPYKTTLRAAAVARVYEIELDAFVRQHLRQCPDRWSEGQQLETPALDALTDEDLLWVASKCRSGRLHTLVFAPGEEPF
jgi:hypothetical protein